MDQKLKSRWVVALRSGNYQQGAGCLRADKRYCCLGVYAEINGLFDVADGDVNPDSALLPATVMSLVDQNYLCNMNDHGANFAQVADYIESNL